MSPVATETKKRVDLVQFLKDFAEDLDSSSEDEPSEMEPGVTVPTRKQWVTARKRRARQLAEEVRADARRVEEKRKPVSVPPKRLTRSGREF